MTTISVGRREAALLGLFLLSAAACLAAVAAGRPDWVLAAKPIPALALAALLLPAATAYGRLVAGGLLLSAAGDILLELGPERFLLGVGAFFLAHLAYIAAFVSAEKRWRLFAAVPALMLGLLVFPRLLPGLERQGLYLPVLVYTLALCAMMWRALARLGPVATASLYAGALGATAFALSDSLLALDRFAPEGAPVPGVRYAILVLYWLGQLGIALSASRTFR